MEFGIGIDIDDDGNIAIFLDRDSAIRLHDLLAMSWFPTRHPHADDNDLLFVDTINESLSTLITQ